MTEQAITLLKHLKIVTHLDITYAIMVQPGISGYADRVAFLQRAAQMNNLK